MPELPDVEIFRNYLNATALHKKIKTVRVSDDRILSDVSRRTLQRRLKGRELQKTRRHGKHLFAKISADGWLMLHFGMTGFLQFYKNRESRPPHVALEMVFEDDYRLAYDSQRRLGRVGLAKHPQTFAVEQNLGPDAMNGLGSTAFGDLMSGKSGMIKPALMNQKLIAGIGNIYADEILFQAKVHPKTPAEDLGNAELDRIFRAMQQVFEAAAEARADPDEMPDGFLLPRRREGAYCPRCGGKIEKIKVSGRSGYMCPDCQKGPG